MKDWIWMSHAIASGVVKAISYRNGEKRALRMEIAASAKAGIYGIADAGLSLVDWAGGMIVIIQ